jgi:hypothetical protein
MQVTVKEAGFSYASAGQVITQAKNMVRAEGLEPSWAV